MLETRGCTWLKSARKYKTRYILVQPISLRISAAVDVKHTKDVRASQTSSGGQKVTQGSDEGKQCFLGVFRGDDERKAK
jgi:hypothetical protein